MCDARRIKARTRADQIAHRAAQQGTGQGAGRSGIANAHFTADEQLRTVCHRAQGTVAPGLQRQQPLGRSHGRGLGEVGGAGGDAHLAHPGQLHLRRCRTQVNHFQLRVQLAGQHADGRAAVDKIVQHLPCDGLGVGGNAFGDHTMVCGEDGDPHLGKARFDLALQTGQLHSHGFKLAEGAGGFGQLLLARQRLRVYIEVNGTTGVQPPGMAHNAGPLRVRGRPATVSTTRSQRSAMAWCNQPASST
ncbi:hypothetical protein D3C80_991160 [compost metagenome]